MQTEILIAGFGGQGVMFAGQVLTYAAMDIGKQVTWIPSYGPEMRGGTANCMVIIADEEIGSPLVKNPLAAIVMNLPSLEKYEQHIKSGGTLIVNSSMIDRPARRADILVIPIPSNEIAEQIGDRRLACMVCVGALLACLQIMKIDEVESSLNIHMPKRHRNLLMENYQVLHKGEEFTDKLLKKSKAA